MAQSRVPRSCQSMVRALQITACVFMLGMVILCLIILKVNNISVKNTDALLAFFSGSELKAAVMIIIFCVIKSFALVFPPAILYAVSGLIFKSIWTAFAVNFIATLLSLILPYFLGRFAGKDMLGAMKNRYPKVKKIDDFAGENDIVIVLLIKAGGLLPGDLSSLIFGSMNIPFFKYFITANIGMLPLNILWTVLGAKGELSNPMSYLYLLPIIIFAVVGSLLVKLYKLRRNKVRPAMVTEDSEG